MKTSLLLSFGFTAAVALLSTLSNLNAADTPDGIDAFQKKIAAWEAKSEQQKNAGQGRTFSRQIKMLQNLIAREDYDRALQTIESFGGGYGFPEDVQDEWEALSDSLSKEIQKRKDERLEKWSKDIDQLVKDTKAGCLEAKTSDDLNPLLLRCSVLQMRQRGGSVMGERLDRKMMGVGSTLSLWANYLDFKNAGNVRSANEQLRSILSNNSTFPVLTVAEIESRMAMDPEKIDSRTVIAGILKDVKSPDDLPAALEKLNALIKSPQAQPDGNLTSEASRMEACIAAWKAAQAGNATEVNRLEGRITSGSSETQSYYAPLKAQIETKMLTSKAGAWTKLTPDPDEDASSFLKRVLDELKSKGDYATMLDVLEFSTRINRSASRSTSSDSASIKLYLTGKRLEEAGDELTAIPNYRNAVASAESAYAPTAEAQEALKRLLQKYPEAAKEQNTALGEQIRLLSEQMKSLSGQIRSQQNRPPGKPY